MNGASVRVFAAQLVFITVSMVAVWYLAVRPMHMNLDTSQALYAQQTEDINAFRRAQQLLPETGSDALVRMGAERELITERLRVSGNSSLVYDKIRSLADDLGIEIERIEPVRTRSGRSVSGSAAIAVESTGHTIKFSGSFGAVAAFVQAVQDEVGMSKVTTVQLVPSRAVSEAPLIDAQLEAMHFRLTRELGVVEEPNP